MTEIRLPAYIDSRYYLVDADGFVYPHGYKQRPAVLEIAEAGGCGVYDVKEKVLIHPVDVEQRVKHLEVIEKRHQEELADTEDRLAKVREARDDGNVVSAASSVGSS
jgi:hypothetical protein